MLYHGEKPWTAPMQLAELFDLPDDMRAALEPIIPQLGFVLDDLTAQDDKTGRPSHWRLLSLPHYMAWDDCERDPFAERMVASPIEPG